MRHQLAHSSERLVDRAIEFPQHRRARVCHDVSPPAVRRPVAEPGRSACARTCPPEVLLCLAAFAATKEMPDLMSESPIRGAPSHGGRPEATVWALPGNAPHSRAGGESHCNVRIVSVSDIAEIVNLATVHCVHVI